MAGERAGHAAVTEAQRLALVAQLERAALVDGGKLEHERAPRAAGRGAHRAAGLGEAGAHVRGGAVAIVGQRLDDDGDAAWPVALVADLVIVLRIAARGLLDRPVDVVLRHRRCPAPL